MVSYHQKLNINHSNEHVGEGGRVKWKPNRLVTT